jgi:hypothetical protein
MDDDKPTIDQEARRLDLRADERDLERSYSVTEIAMVVATVVVVVLILVGAFLVR